MKNKGGRPSKYDEHLIDTMRTYVGRCVEDNVLPTVEGFACIVDVDADTVGAWSKKHKRFLGALKKLKTTQCQMLEQSLYKGGSNAAGPIFLLKNNHGFKDRTEQDITSGGKALPQPILKVNPNVLSGNNGDKKDL